MQVKVISGHLVKKVKPQKWDKVLQYMFLGQIFAKYTKNDPKTLFEKSNRSKNKNRKMKEKKEQRCFMS